jgi:hypothetical protein
LTGDYGRTRDPRHAPFAPSILLGSALPALRAGPAGDHGIDRCAPCTFFLLRRSLLPIFDRLSGMDSMHRAPIGDPGRDSRLSSFTHRLPAATQCTATGIAPVASAATTARDRYFPCAAGHSATLDPPPLTSARFAPSAMASPAHCSSTSPPDPELRTPLVTPPSCAPLWFLRPKLSVWPVLTHCFTASQAAFCCLRDCGALRHARRS